MRIRIRDLVKTGSGIRDGKSPILGSSINIRDPQHCTIGFTYTAKSVGWMGGGGVETKATNRLGFHYLRILVL